MKITDKMRLSIFILGYRLVTYEGKWCISRPGAYESDTLMLGCDTEAGPNEGYFNSAEKAMDSFIIESQRTAAIRAEYKKEGR